MISSLTENYIETLHTMSDIDKLSREISLPTWQYWSLVHSMRVVQHLLISKKLCPITRTYDGPFVSILLDMAEQMLLQVFSAVELLCTLVNGTFALKLPSGLPIGSNDGSGSA